MPDPEPGCALVETELSGICGTDKHTFQGYTTQYGNGELEFPGHECESGAGTVELN